MRRALRISVLILQKSIWMR